MLQEPTFWVAMSFLGFIGVAIYFKLPGMITKQLDDRSARIAKELEEAQRLREDAQALYAEYKRKAENAVKEAEQILAQVKTEAEEMAKESAAALEVALQRRQVAAEARIAQAEAQAVTDVRAATVELAIGAARDLLNQEVIGAKAAELIDKSVADLSRNLN